MNASEEPRESRQQARADKTERSGAVAALLSALFPGLGQAYLRRRRDALIFAVPVILLLLALFYVFSQRGAAVKVIDPSVSFTLILVVVSLGVWWIAGIVHAWLHGRHDTSAATAVVALLIIVIAAGDAFAAVQLWRVRNAGEVIFTANPLDQTPPPATASPTPLPPGETLNPLATPTQRPPDYVDPSDDPIDEPIGTIEPGPTPGFDITTIDTQDDGLLNVLLVGLDWQPGRTSKRTDTMLVLSVNSQTGEVLMFSFPRDTARLPLFNGGTYNGKLNTFAGFANSNPDIYPEGGMKALSYEIGYLLGIPIDYYASVNMPGFMSVVDLVGGITVTNTRNISDDQLQFYLPPGTYRLNPADALRYVRSRHGSGGDFGRAERQQQVLSALRKELLKPENIAKLPDIVEALSQVVNTDFPPGQVDQLLQLADKVESEPSRSWIFGFPQWADHQRRVLTCGRSVQSLRMDKIAALSIELFGDNSLWNGKTPPGPPPPRDCPSP